MEDALRDRAVVITGVAGPVGRRVATRLAASRARVVGIDVVAPSPPIALSEIHVADVVAADLKPLLERCDTVVHLAFAYGPDLDDEQLEVTNIEGTRRLLDAASDASVSHLVYVSSAAVYGAWPDNPVPLTEDATLRPNPELAYAVQKAECERLCLEWRNAVTGRTVTVLRPTIALGTGDESWLARSLWAARAVRSGPQDPPFQFVHVDDLADAVAVATGHRLDDVFNVAADGWIAGETVRALAGTPPPMPVPERLVTRAAELTWRLRVGRTPPGLIPYTMHPWVVATDRLRAAGWSPTYSNEEAFVAAHEGTWWSRLTPNRRQGIAVAAAGVVLTGAVGGVVGVVRRARRR